MVLLQDCPKTVSSEVMKMKFGGGYSSVVGRECRANGYHLL